MSNGPESNISSVLANLGRASTPTVKQSKFGITLGQLIPLNQEQLTQGRYLVVGSNSFWDFVGERADFVPGTPGLLAELAGERQFDALIIETGAFDEGQWLGADNGVARALAEELFEAGRVMRATGRNVFMVRDKNHFEGADYAYIQSTFTVRLHDIPEVDMEEQAPQSAVWDLLVRYVENQN
ncbi:hypothetical protein [Corynebacterium sp. H130]|uniref:hypothetical protein n=1 Tax=Corynebacterium sp. H130 TaxID=3133444 RepID=UPI0030B27758